MPSTPASAVRDASPTRDSTPLRIRTTSPSAAPLVVKPTGRGSVPPLRFGRFLVAPGDRVALRHIVEHHVPAGSLRRRLARRAALGALDRGLEGVAVSLLRRRYGAKMPGPLEVDAVWAAVRTALKSCGLTGVSIRVHALAEPAGGLGYGGDLVGFGRRGGMPEADHPLVVVRVRPHKSPGAGLVHEARALASVRGALPSPWRELVPAPLAHRVEGDVEVLAIGFLPGRALPLDLPRRPSPRTVQRAVAVAATLADVQNAMRADGDAVATGSIVPDDPAHEEWSRELRERLDVRPVPLVQSHGGLAPDAVLFDGGGVSGFVEWSRHRAADLPTRDLFDFLMAYARRLDRRSSLDTVALMERAFVRKNRVSEAVREALAAYGARRELGFPTLGGLFRLHLLTTESGCGSEAARSAALRVLDEARETVFTP